MRRASATIALLTVIVAASGGVAANAVPSQRVTLSAQPLVLAPNGLLTVFGAIDSNREGEIVTIQTKDCRLPTFTGVATATTGGGGSFRAELRPNVGTEVRAFWKGATSAPVTIRQRPFVSLFRRPGRRFEVGVSNKELWHKRVLFQIRRGRWRTMKSVLLTDTAGQPGSPFVFTSATFKASVPRGTQVRAVLTAAQAGPCYLAAVSDVLRA